MVNSSLKKFLFLRLQMQRSSVVGVCHLASEREDHVQHHCRGSSIRHVVEFVVTAAAVLRDNISVNDFCEAHDSST